jgi:hypothetical protein
MSIFGDLDVDSIPDNPNYVKGGRYLATPVKSEIRHTKEDSKHSVVITWAITSEESEYHGRYVQQWLDYPLWKFDKEVDELTPDMKRQLSRIKATCKAVGITDDQLKGAGFEDIATLSKGTDAWVIVRNWEDKGDRGTMSGVNQVYPVNN